MPELPEVETVKRTLSPHLIGKTIITCENIRGEVIKHPDAMGYAAAVSGRRIEDLGRRGKYLLIRLDSGDSIVVHLRMTGRLLYAEAAHPRQKHTHVVMHLDDGCELRFCDTRRFGCLWLLGKDEEDSFTGMQNLGIEPFDEQFSAAYLQQHLGKRKITAKQGILDQAVLAGLGNIYADEALFAAGVHPQKPCTQVTAEQWQKLAEAIPPILCSSIANNGTTFNDYRDGEGKEGANLPFLQAYGRGGQPCRRCGALLAKTRVGGRGTVFCPICQPE